MDEMNEMSVKLSKFLTDHIEKFACAFAKETGLDPTKIKMVQQSLDNGFGYKVWFEPFPKESEIEMYRIRAENAEARAKRAEVMVERLMRMVEDRFVLLGNSLDGHLQDCNCAVFLSSRMERDAWSELCYEWHGIYSDWQSANGHQARKVSENEESEE